MTLSVRLAPEIMERLQALADKTGRSMSFYARQAILQYLEDMEDTFIAIERLEKPVKRWTLEELENGLDLESGVGRPRPKGTATA